MKHIQMARDLWKSTINKSQGNVTLSEHRYPTTASPRYPKTTKTQENCLKSNILKMTGAVNKELKKSHNKIKYKQVEVFKKKTNKSLKDIQENTIKQV